MQDASLDLGVIGNGSVGALIDATGRIVWCCLPAFDSDPVFCALMSPREHDAGYFAVELEGLASAVQQYEPNTAVLTTILRDNTGNALEITDFAPRYRQYGRFYHPVTLMRRLRPVSGQPRVRVRLRPLRDYGAAVPERTWGSNHVRYLLDGWTLRLTTDLSLPHVRDELSFLLDRTAHLLLGPDETVTDDVARLVRDQLEQTRHYWREWVRNLSVPVDWQAAVIRAAITLKLCQYEGSGAIVAAMTTSIPESPDSGRNWDYRYCWLRDAAFVVRALNRLGATRSMEEYLRFIANIATAEDELQPLYGIHYERELHERIVPGLAGYRGMEPVRVGNAAWTQRQHDAYGSVLLATSQLFFDQRITPAGNVATFERLEPLGRLAARLYATPDAGIWEYRGRTAAHTYSAVMCWAACDRLARIAAQIGLTSRAEYWRQEAVRLHADITARAWHGGRHAFTACFGDEALDASVLLMHDVGFIRADDPRFIATVEAVGEELRHGSYVFRYRAADDFGLPHSTFNLCTFWYIDALAALGHCDEARELFTAILARANPLGLFSEDIDPTTGEAWGNFPQTYSMVGLIQAAMRLSRRWEEVV
mgnify:CR=1 FL=1